MLFLIIFCKNQLNNTYIKSDSMSCQLEVYVYMFLVKRLKVNYQGALEKHWKMSYTENKYVWLLFFITV